MNRKRQQLPWSREIIKFINFASPEEFRNDDYKGNHRLQHIDHEQGFGYAWWAPAGELEMVDFGFGKIYTIVYAFPDRSPFWRLGVRFYPITDGQISYGLFEDYEREMTRKSVIKIARFLRGKGKRPKPLPGFNIIVSYVNSTLGEN
jgi:hypothetical protein